MYRGSPVRLRKRQVARWSSVVWTLAAGSHQPRSMRGGPLGQWRRSGCCAQDSRMERHNNGGTSTVGWKQACCARSVGPLSLAPTAQPRPPAAGRARGRAAHVCLQPMGMRPAKGEAAARAVQQGPQGRLEAEQEENALGARGAPARGGGGGAAATGAAMRGPARYRGKGNNGGGGGHGTGLGARSASGQRCGTGKCEGGRGNRARRVEGEGDARRRPSTGTQPRCWSQQ